MSFGKILGAALETAEDWMIQGLRAYRIANRAIGTAIDQFVKEFEEARPKDRKPRN